MSEFNIDEARRVAAEFAEKREAATAGEWTYFGEALYCSFKRPRYNPVGGLADEESLHSHPQARGGKWGYDCGFIVHAANSDIAALLLAACERVEELERNNRICKQEFDRAISCVDRIFQQGGQPEPPILPDYAVLGANKFDECVRLAKDYRKAVVMLEERTLQHKTQLDNALRLLAERDALKQRVEALEAAAKWSLKELTSEFELTPPDGGWTNDSAFHVAMKLHQAIHGEPQPADREGE